MTQSMYGTWIGDWRCMTQESFGLQPRQLSTLAAIVAFFLVEDEPMPSAELHRYEAKAESEGIYTVDAGCVSQLVRLAPVDRLGSQAERLWRPTRAGIHRVLRS
jgi:hypothetical protein